MNNKPGARSPGTIMLGHGTRSNHDGRIFRGERWVDVQPASALKYGSLGEEVRQAANAAWDEVAAASPREKRRRVRVTVEVYCTDWEDS